jgi:methylthioribose-1-phosphate isomerase
MVVRGAPAIGITAALALATELVKQGGGSQFSSAQEAAEFVQEQAAFLETRRATRTDILH